MGKKTVVELTKDYERLQESYSSLQNEFNKLQDQVNGMNTLLLQVNDLQQRMRGEFQPSVENIISWHVHQSNGAISYVYPEKIQQQRNERLRQQWIAEHEAAKQQQQQQQQQQPMPPLPGPPPTEE